MADSVFKRPEALRGKAGGGTGSPSVSVASALNGTSAGLMTTQPGDGLIPNKVISPIAQAFDPARTRCAAEAVLWSAIEKNEEFHQRLMKKVTERQDFLVRDRLGLLTEAYRVDPAITPKIGALREILKSTLRLVQPIDTYVKANPEANAFCMPSRKGTRLIMCLHSALFDLLTPHELLFTMGHEVGHALLGHARVPQLAFDDPDFSPLEVVRIRALGRRQELSCDRIGLLACQDVRVAGSALLKIMCGLPDRWLEFDEAAYARQFDQIGEMAELAPMDDAASTHPIIALRVKALMSFANSRLYSEALGQPPNPQADADFEKSTEHMLSVLEPDLSELETASEQDAANRLLVRGALVVVAADGALEPAEVKYLKSKMTLTEELVASMKRPDFIEVSMPEIAGAATILVKKLSLRNRAGLLHQLCLVALAAGGYATGEQEALGRIAQMLEIPQEMFQQVVDGAQVTVSEEAVKTKATKPTRRKRQPKAAPAGEGTAGLPNGVTSSAQSQVISSGAVRGAEPAA
jgi:tellurite resistance protein